MKTCRYLYSPWPPPTMIDPLASFIGGISSVALLRYFRIRWPVERVNVEYNSSRRIVQPKRILTANSENTLTAILFDHFDRLRIGAAYRCPRECSFAIHDTLPCGPYLAPWQSAHHISIFPIESSRPCDLKIR